MLKTRKQITDAVHGTIPLTQVEIDVIDTGAFQRLRQVRQLGLVPYVFPGADYSRFTHSIGACHLAGRFISALRASGHSISAGDEQLYRLAGLLHDLGHYPFSHTTQDALEKLHENKTKVQQVDGLTVVDISEESPPFDHEELGRIILGNDSALQDALIRNGVSPDELGATFKSSPLKNLISSDLDADRMDFLLRTAHFSGLGYAAVDTDYLMSQVRLDDKGRVCFSRKAVRAIDHLLVGRYFDYQTMAFNKVVSGFEMLLTRVVQDLVEEGQVDLSPSHILKLIKSEGWSQIDDPWLIGQIRAFAARRSSPGDMAGVRARALLARHAPQLVASVSYLGSPSGDSHIKFKAYKEKAEALVSAWENDFGLKGRVFLWDIAGKTLTKIAGLKAVDLEYEDAEDLQESVRVSNRSGGSSPIMSVPNSLMRILSQNAQYALRIFVLLDLADRTTMTKLRESAAKEFKEFEDWEVTSAEDRGPFPVAAATLHPAPTSPKATTPSQTRTHDTRRATVKKTTRPKPAKKSDPAAKTKNKNKNRIELSKPRRKRR